MSDPARDIVIMGGEYAAPRILETVDLPSVFGMDLASSSMSPGDEMG